MLEERLIARRNAARGGATASVPRRTGPGPAPLSFGQRRLWFLDRFEPGSIAYNIPLVLRLKGSLEIPALEAALSDIVSRHEALRTTFPDAHGEPVQQIMEARPVTLAPIETGRSKAERLSVEEARRPFDLAAGPLVRFQLLCLSGEEHWLVTTMHHIVSDGWSLGVFQRELITGYSARAAGHAPQLPELPVQYPDYAEWQHQWLAGEALSRELSYWKDQLRNAPTLLDLPTDRPRPTMRNYEGARYTIVLPHALGRALQELGKRHQTTLFMVLLTTLNVLLSRYTGQHDICIGSPIAGRTRTELEGLMGVFVNMLVLRTDLSGDPSFLELLDRVRTVTLGAFSHQDVPFEKLVEELQPERDTSRTPLFQAMLVVQNAPSPPSRTPMVEFERVFIDTETAKFDLTFFVREGEDGLRISIEYSTELFEDSTVARMAEQLRTLLEGIVEEPELHFSALPLLPEEERRRLLVDWNETRVDYPSASCVHELISAQAQRSAETTAVEFAGERWTYAELEERSNRLAHYLQGLGVGTETLVGLYVERSLEMMVGLLGILKAGGAYLPLDSSFPLDRLSFMVRDAGVSVLLTQSALRDSLPEHDARVVELDSEWPAIENESATAVTRAAGPENLAYVIYTSGSTGLPKGVPIEHRALVNFLCSMSHEPGITAADTLLAVTTLSFDIAGLELFLPLLSGACVVVASREESSDGRYLADLVHTSGATVMQATPATWRMLLDAGWKGSEGLKVLCGGDALSRDLADALLERCDSLWNLYGPTETTVWSTVHRVERGGGSIVVGRPIANTRVYLLDETGQPVPTGVPGELCIGGEGLARGYLGLEALTAERFRSDPFVTTAGARVYRTGDLARYHADGNIEVLGRLDHQVKIRGFRIELGEIESVLATHPAVRQAVVVAREDVPGDKNLVAYFVTESSSRPTVGELRLHLKEKLPEYMVPTACVPLPSFPLTPNGKVDRRGLPAPQQSRAGLEKSFVAPRDEIELQLAAIWQGLLGVEQVSVHDSFFDLGGHSLLAVRMFALIEERMGTRLPLATLFEKTTIRELAEVLRGAEGGAPWSCLVPIQGGDGRPPLFCIHAEGDEVLFYRDFARLLGPEQPVYGLQARGLDGEQTPHATIEEMAAYYVEEIRRVQAEGPYFLGGHCYGGVVMFEMAQQLRQQGQKVALLAMMDGSAPRINTSFDATLRYAWKAASSSPGRLLAYVLMTEIPTRVSRTSRKLRDRLHRSGHDEPQDAVIAAQDRVRGAIANAYMHYEPKPYPGHITYFMNSQRARLPHDKWAELAGEGLDLHVFPGTPNTTFVSPSLEVLAAQVRDCLRTAQESCA